MPSISNLPLWAKSLVAPGVVLTAMLTMAIIAMVDLGRQETGVAALNSDAFEALRSAMSATASVADIQTELFHLTSAAANETDKSKVQAMGAQLTSRLAAVATQMPGDVTADSAAYKRSAQQVIENTVSDAAMAS